MTSRTLETVHKTIKLERPQAPLWAYHLCSADMNVQQLRYLIAVSDFGSVSAAARSLGVTQPVVSRSIHAFEAEHGVTMFALSGTRLVVTEEGEPIVDAARDALAAFDARRTDGAGGEGQAGARHRHDAYERVAPHQSTE